MHETLALLALAVMLAVAVRRPRGVPEVAVAVPMVAILIAVGAVTQHQARTEISRLGPVVGFLAAMLVIAECCDEAGLFRAAGVVLTRAAGRSPSRLLVAVVVLASVTTALLSLDTTVVLLTPVVVASVRSTDAPPRPALYATVHLANSASLLLPVSNLTNLLAYAVVSISFTRFAALMALPWLIAIVVEWLATRGVFAGDFDRALSAPDEARVVVPRFATTIVVVTVVGFAVASVAGVAPVWVATGGAVVLAAERLVRGRTSVVRVVRSAGPSFCLYVLGLGVVVRAVSADGLARVVRHVVPSGSSLLTLLAIAAVSALLANLMNNLPATLVLVPIAATSGLAPVLAVLIGVDIGPNLTYPGSLATLLWRRAVHGVTGVPTVTDFSRLAAVTVPVGIVVSTVALWAAVRLIGTG